MRKAVLATVFLSLTGLTGLIGQAAAESRCDTVLRHLSRQLADATCVESADLTTTNPATTPNFINGSDNVIVSKSIKAKLSSKLKNSQ